MNLQQMVQWMLENGYMIEIKGKFKVTAKFNKEVTGKTLGIVMHNDKPVVVDSLALLPLGDPNLNWADVYLRFIKEAEVPQRGEGGAGSYDLNKYSEPAMKAFRKMIEKEKIQYAILVKSTMLYYKTHSRFPLSISNYIEKGYWRTDYMGLQMSAENGSIESHIKNEIDSTTDFSHFKLG